jgi:hypothetical protein
LTTSSTNNDVILITPDVSKIRDARLVTIQPNLKAWLTRYNGPIFPPGWRRNISSIRRRFGLNKPEMRDLLRHTYIANHVMQFGSFAETAIEAGNSETVFRKSYFNRVTRADAQRFWRIMPAAEPANIVPMVQAS